MQFRLSDSNSNDSFYDEIHIGADTPSTLFLSSIGGSDSYVSESTINTDSTDISVTNRSSSLPHSPSTSPRILPDHLTPEAAIAHETENQYSIEPIQTANKLAYAHLQHDLTLDPSPSPFPVSYDPTSPTLSTIAQNGTNDDEIPTDTDKEILHGWAHDFDPYTLQRHPRPLERTESMYPIPENFNPHHVPLTDDKQDHLRSLGKWSQSIEDLSTMRTLILRTMDRLEKLIKDRDLPSDLVNTHLFRLSFWALQLFRINI